MPQSTSLGAEDGSIVERLREELQQQVAEDPGNYFVFLIGVPMMDIDAAPYGGARYPIDARMDGRTFIKFHLDVGVGDIVISPTEKVELPDWLSFTGLKPPVISMLSKEQQFSEKLHAYTLPDRQTPNSRVKDLVDMIILIERGEMVSSRVSDSIAATFLRRKTHELPGHLAPPPESWLPVFERLASECNMPINMDTAYETLQSFIEDL